MTAADPITPPANQAAPAPAARQDEDREDSGLHDIRNLAQSTKQRLSSRRITSPPVEDDVLASSSGSFKNIALPQPAKMVSLPELAELPPAADVAAADKAAKKAAKEAAKARKSEPAIAAAAPAAVAPAAAAIEAPAAAPAAPARQAFSLPSQQKKSKGPLIALLGTGLAAAAGAVIYMQVNQSADTAPAPSAAAPAAETAVAQAAPTVEPIVQPAPPPAPAEPPVEEATTEPVAAAQIAADEGKAEDKNDDDKAQRKVRAKASKKADKDEEPAKPEAKTEKVDVKKAEPAKGSGAEPEPSFDALLKEAGVVEKKDAKPKLAKKSLTGSDFKTGMKPVTAKAKACYTGTQGIAMIKLTVAPSGQVSKVSVTGAFAGKPEASCVESAIQAATFPPWDGGPQSFTYSVLLSD